MSQIEQVTAAIRDRILGGRYAPGSRLMELPIADELGVSRTPVRLALSFLEREGLIITEGPKRGFTVRSFELHEVFDAIETRGVLEGMAARLAAERGISDDAMRLMEKCVRVGADLLANGFCRVDAQVAWVQNNVDFHAGIVQACGNRSVAELIQRVSAIPLASTASIVLETSDPDGDRARLERVQRDHGDIFEAIAARQGDRAEHLMREHALTNIKNKKLNFATMETRHAQGFLPGAGLINEPGQTAPAARKRSRA